MHARDLIMDFWISDNALTISVDLEGGFSTRSRFVTGLFLIPSRPGLSRRGVGTRLPSFHSDSYEIGF